MDQAESAILGGPVECAPLQSCQSLYKIRGKVMVQTIVGAHFVCDLLHNDLGFLRV